MEVLVQLLGISLWVFAICSTLFVLFNLRQNPDLFYQQPSRTQYVFFVVYLIVLATFFKGGVEELLFFIPSDWVVADEWGEFNSFRSKLSLVIGIIMSLWIGILIIPKLFKRNKIVLEIEEGSKMLTDLERFDKTNILGEYAESKFIIRQLDRKRSEHTNIKKYLDARKKEIEEANNDA